MDVPARPRSDTDSTIVGALAGFVMTATALAPISAGAAYDLFGAYDPLFWTFAALSAVSSGLVLLVRAPSASIQPAPAATRVAQ